MSFTPGPWVINPYAAGADGFRIMSENAGRLAYVATWSPLHRDEGEANARLIAAAPEMYEALKAMSHVEARDPGHVESIRAFGLARNAIAKAEGK